MTDLLEVHHKGIKGTAHVPATALRLMPGWEPVDASAMPSQEGPYEGSTIAALRDEIDRRNQDRSDEARLSKGGKKQDLVRTLQDDDAAQAAPADQHEES